MNIVAFILAIFGASLVLMCGIIYLKAKDVFTQVHIVMIANLYAIPLLLLGIEIEKFSLVSLIKIFALIILNIVVVNLICHLIVRRAMINKIKPEAEFKRVI